MDALGIDRAHIMGGCMGCSPVAAFGVAHPERTLSMTHYWPVGGAKYRISSHQRFREHLEFVKRNGLQAVVDLVHSHDATFRRIRVAAPGDSLYVTTISLPRITRR